MLTVKYRKKGAGMSWHQAIDAWLRAQRNDLVYVFVSFYDIALRDCPRVYVATPLEIANHLKGQLRSTGAGVLR